MSDYSENPLIEENKLPAASPMVHWIRHIAAVAVEPFLGGVTTRLHNQRHHAQALL
jgi:hypothetical protein